MFVVKFGVWSCSSIPSCVLSVPGPTEKRVQLVASWLDWLQSRTCRLAHCCCCMSVTEIGPEPDQLLQLWNHTGDTMEMINSLSNLSRIGWRHMYHIFDTCLVSTLVDHTSSHLHFHLKSSWWKWIRLVWRDCTHQLSSVDLRGFTLCRFSSCLRAGGRSRGGLQQLGGVKPIALRNGSHNLF